MVPEFLLKLICNCSYPHTLDTFNAMLPQVVKKMSNDKKLLYLLILAINKGSIDEKLAGRRIGPVHQARWLTLASRRRILRIYISVPDHLGAVKCLAGLIQLFGP